MIQLDNDTVIEKYFYKYLKRSHANEMIRFGRIRLGTCHEFRDYEEKDSERIDKTEGKRDAYSRIDELVIKKPQTQEDLPPFLRNLFGVPEGGSNVDIALKHFNIIQEEIYENVYVYCMTDTPDKKVMKEFQCDTCVRINNVNVLIKTIATKLANRKLAYKISFFKPCTYDGKQNNYDEKEDIYWLKEPKYRQQNEYRLVLLPPKENSKIEPLIIACKEIASVCEIIEL